MSRIALWDEIRRLNAEGTTVLLTTQYLEEADQLAERVAIIDHGRIVKHGAPSELKAEVGCPTLFITVDDHQLDAARDQLSTIGELRPSSDGTIGVGLTEGAGAISDVVRRLDESGITVHNLQLREPSLDDVFAEATGYRLEGADTGTADQPGARTRMSPAR
jgi:ABC-2 type transport system ATP-binding protein